jgi:GWxTD domain-containing protein
VKSFWTSYVVRRGRIAALAALLLVGLSPAVDARKGKKPKSEDLTNFLLSPEYSQWLVGPISHIATSTEINEYLALHSDAAAARFVEAFWAERDRGVIFPGTRVSQRFAERVATADKFYSEAAKKGSATDRGTVYVLYGNPSVIRYEALPRDTTRSIEEWIYEEGSEAGLDGKQPEHSYRFWKEGELTVFYRGAMPRRDSPQLSPTRGSDIGGNR